MNPTVTALLDQARQETGLENFGDEARLEGLKAYIETLDRHAKDEAGKGRLLKIQYKKLLSRLKIYDAFDKHPEILKEEIKQPLFVTGLPRSGTSALLNLIAAEPDSRALAQWELRNPEPYPGLAKGEPDPRYLAVVEKMRAAQNSEFQKMHYADADTPEECVMLHQLSFDGVQTGFEIMLEPYGSWFLNHDLRPMYEEYRDFLKILQWQRPGVRWSLKAPAHMWAIDPLFEVFPDANIVWGHRDPLNVSASICSMNRQVMSMYMGDCSHLDQKEIGRTVMNFYASSLEKGLEARARYPESRFTDYNHKEFLKDPIALIERIYGHFGFGMRDDQRSALQQHSDSNPPHKHGTHQYSLDDFGISEQGVRERYQFYSFEESYN